MFEVQKANEAKNITGQAEEKEKMILVFDSASQMLVLWCFYEIDIAKVYL